MRTHIKNNAWWLQFDGFISGAEPGEGGEGGSEGGDGSGSGEGGSNDGSQEGAGEGQGSSGTGGQGEGASDDAAGLKSALQKEREERKALDKELKTLRKAQQERADAEKTEVQRLTDKSTADGEKITKLATKFRNQAVRQAIISAAGKEKFLDPSDAVTNDVIAAITVEQDEDDPSEVTVDPTSVANAVKALAKKKPHWLSTGEQGKGKQPKSGSTFGGSGSQGQGDPQKTALAAKYPALRGL